MKTNNALLSTQRREDATAQWGDDLGLRREAKRHAAFVRATTAAAPKSPARSKAVSPLCSATAVQIFVSLLRLTRHSVATAVCVFALMPLGLSAATNDLSGLLQRGLFEEEANRNLDAAAQAYQTVSAQFDKDRKLAATAIFRLGEIYRKRGKTNEAVAQYERIVREFADQDTLVTLSRQNLGGLVSLTTGAGPQKTGADEQEVRRLETEILEARVQARQITARLAGYNSANNFAERLPFISDEAMKGLFCQNTELDRKYSSLKATRDKDDPELATVRKQYDENQQQLEAADQRYQDALDLELQSFTAKAAALQNRLDLARGLTTGGTVTSRSLETELALLKAQLEQARKETNALFVGRLFSIPAMEIGLFGELSREALPKLLAYQELRVRTLESAISQARAGAATNATNFSIPTATVLDEEEAEIRRIQAMIQNSPDLINGGLDGLSPLFRAAERGQLRVANFLLDNGASVNKPSGGQTPLHHAVQMGNKAMVQLLLERGADVTAKDGTGGTALHEAAQDGFLSIAEVLLKYKADLNARSSKANGEQSPLHLAARNGHAALVGFLLANGDDANRRDAGGHTPLHLVAVLGRDGVVEPLLKSGADVNATDTTGETPLMNAAGRGNAEIVSLLLKNKADPNLGDAKGNTALLNSIEARSPKAVRALLAGGANPELSRPQDWSPLLQAVANNLENNIVLALVEAKANVNAVSLVGKTPLHYAVEYSRKDLVELLLTAGADVNLRDNAGKTPLDYTKPSLTPSAARVVRRQTTEDEPTAKPADIAALLRQHGALDDLPAFDRIQVKRPAANFSKTIFSKGTNDGQHFTLFELIAVQYQFLAAVPGGEGGSREDTLLLAMNDHRVDALAFPDLAHVRLRRPAPDGKNWEEQVLDLGALLRSGDCSKDVPLHWGDEVVIPETDHPLGAPWAGFSRAELKSLNQCLTRTVEIIVKGQSTKITAGPKFEYLELGNSPYVVTKAPIWIQPVLRSSNLLLSSSDLARVKITRRDAATGQAREWVLDCSGNNAPAFWLRDGDVIEVPDKP